MITYSQEALSQEIRTSDSHIPVRATNPDDQPEGG
jgi:hypothetical protein